jgi:hypothetical protein
MSPPAKVLAEDEVRLMVPVPVTVRLVEVAAFHAVLEPASVHVPDPTAIVLVFELDELTAEDDPERVTLKVAASNVPFVIRNALDKLVPKASCNVTDPFGVSIAKPCVNVAPALVIV